ncbi:MAG: LamG domain-containing protein, partial [Thaumarchaeota archaeon]|nr:LamG domain-containing protein [Nitrososphaerota archaeon]
MKSAKIISLSLVFVLVFSSFSASYGDIIFQNQKHVTALPTFVEKPTGTTLTKDFTIYLDERKIQFTNQEVTVQLIKKPTSEYTSRLHIDEDMTVSNFDGSENQIYLFKHNQIGAILERVFNFRKFKFDKIIGLPISAASIVSLYNDLGGSLDSDLGNGQNVDFDKISFDIGNIFATEFDTDLFELQQVNNVFSTQLVYDKLTKQVGIVTDSFEQQSSTFLFIFAITAFYIIVRSEDPKIKIQNYNRILSLVFISMLISAAVVTPLSISSSYYAHAQTVDDTNSINAVTPEPPSTSYPQVNDANSGVEVPLSSIIDSSEHLLNDIIIDSNFTSLDKQENPDSIQTNSTIQTTQSNSITTPTNSTTTQTDFIPPATPVQAILSLIESLSMNGNTATPTNSTTTQTDFIPPATPVQAILSLIESLSMNGNTATPTNSVTPEPALVPNATKSWNVNANTTDSQFIGDVFVNQTGILLNGGFIKAGGNYTNQTSNLAVAAWIKPEYASGASMFTILSKDKSFALTLNNILYPQHIATFSVFDGIKWHQVQTNVELDQNWSHIAATFNGTNILIYVNGTLSNTVKTTPTATVDSAGSIQTTTPQVSSKDSDIVIGATLDTRAVDSPQGVFSGSLDEIAIYDKYLTADQVVALYQKTLPLILTKLIPIKQVQIEIPPINLLNQTGINGTLNTNATEYVVVPTINQTNQITISTWVDPEYNKLSDEMTVVSKDRSFALSLNGIIDPQHTVKFSVFDGIHWTEIQGTSKIESKSHLAAVINGTDLLLYVNGTLQGRKTLQSSFAVLEGELIATSAAVANSATDVVIGASISSLRKEKDPQLSNKFSGTINDAIIYNRALTEYEIKQLYTSQIVDTASQPLVPLFSENILSFTDVLTLTYIPRETTNSTDVASDDSLAFTDSIAIILNKTNMATNIAYTSENKLGLTDYVQIFQIGSYPSNTTKSNENLGIVDIVEIQKSTYSNATKASELLGITDVINLQKSTQQVKDSDIIFEERGKDYYKVEYKNGTGQVTFGLPEWILDSATNKYVEHIAKETDKEIIYDSMQIPFVFNKNDCSISIYEKGKINSNSQLVIGKKYWKLMEGRSGTDQWSDSQINNNACKVESFGNSTGFFINAIKENKDGKFITTYGKKIDQPLESFLYYTNTNSNNTNTKFGFVEKLENIESDEADLGDQTVTSKPNMMQKFTDKKQKLLNKIVNDLTDLDASTIKELKQNEKLSKKKADIASETISFNKENKESLIFDFSKASKEFSNMSIENKNGKLSTTVEFFDMAKSLKEGETIFLDPTVIFSSGTFVQVAAEGTGTTCPTPDNISQPSQSKATITRTNNAAGCKRTSIEYNISSIPSTAVIADVTTSFTTASFASTRTCEVRPIQIQPTTYTIGGTAGSPEPDAQVLWNDIGNGTAYATGIVCYAASGGPIDLGSGADSDVQTAIDTGRTWFALGWKLVDESRPTVNPTERGSLFSGITLTVKYNFKTKFTENLGIKDAVTAKKTKIALSENLGINDSKTVAITKRISEKLGITQTTNTIKVTKANENLGLTDTVTAKKTKIALSENLGIKDTTQFTRSAAVQAFSENLGLTDTILVGKASSVTLSEKHCIKDTKLAIKN